MMTAVLAGCVLVVVILAGLVAAAIVGGGRYEDAYNRDNGGDL